MKIKHLFAIALILFCAGQAAAVDDVTSRSVTVKPGEEATMTIEAELRPEMKYRTLQLDIEMPEEITLKKDAQGNPLASIAFEGTDHQVVSKTREEGSAGNYYRFMIYSMTNTPFPQCTTNGITKLLTLTIQCDEKTKSGQTINEGMLEDMLLCRKEGNSPAVKFVPRNRTLSFNIHSNILVTLKDAEDNTSLIQTNRNKTIDVMLEGRTLKGGVWNTICLPFNFSLSESPLAGAIVRTLDSYENDGETITIKFKDAVSMNARNPYIVKFSGEDIVDPVFYNVGIPMGFSPTGKFSNNATFIGTYNPLTLKAGDTKKLFLQNGNLYWPEDDVNVNAFRAYFTLPEPVPTTGGAAVRVLIDFGDGETTDIQQLTEKNEVTNADIYDLQGRKVEHPTKGLYIVNGKKVMIN